MAEPKPSNGKRHSHQASYKSGCSSWMLVAGSEWQAIGETGIDERLEVWGAKG